MRKTARRGAVAAAAIACAVSGTVFVSSGARAQTDDIVTNSIAVTKVVIGQSPSAVAPVQASDGRPGYLFSFECTKSDGTSYSHGGFLLLLDVGASSGNTTVDVGAVRDSDDGALECVVSEDAPASGALAGSPAFAVVSQGDSRAADPSADLVTGGSDGRSAVVSFPYTRTNAVAQVTFTNAYTIVAAPTFTG